MHGDGDVGHFGLTRSAVRLENKFCWPAWPQDLKNNIEQCLACENVRMGRVQPRKQVGMMTCEVLRRNQLVAMDVPIVSPPAEKDISRSSSSEAHSPDFKNLVIGGAFTRFMMSVPIKKDNMNARTDAVFKMGLRLWPADELLTYCGSTMEEQVIRQLCDMTGTKNVFADRW